MKKILFAAVLFTCVATTASAQDEGAAYSQGQSTVTLGYGLGNIYKKLFKFSGGFGGFFGTGNYKVSSTGPFALTYEYGVADHISVGVLLGYTSVTGKYTDATFPADNYDEKLTNMQAVLRGNYHFGSSEKFDPYIGLGVGYYNFKYKYNDASGTTSNSFFAVPTSFAFNGQLGAKYYFSSNVGVFLEAGYVAGAYGQGGLAFKF